MYELIGKNGKRYYGNRGSGMLFTDGKKVLLLKRGPQYDNPGKWDLPGGKVEKEENFIDGAMREVKEEIGKLPDYTRADDFDFTDGNFKYKAFVCQIEEPFSGIKLSKEHTGYQWVDIKDLGQYDLHPGLKFALPTLLNSIKEKVIKSENYKMKFNEEDMSPATKKAFEDLQKTQADAMERLQNALNTENLKKMNDAQKKTTLTNTSTTPTTTTPSTFNNNK